MAAPGSLSEVTTKVRTVCSYCGVGCGMVLDIGRGPDGRRTVLKATGDKEHPANFGRLCTKGATTADMLAAPGRLTTALIRPDRGGELQPAPVAAAVAETARRLRAIIDEHGPDAVALYVSGQMTLEAQYLANKLAKGFIRTNQIESNSRLCMASAGTGYKLSLGADGPPGSYQDFDQADVFFVIGSNMADCHPILFLRMMDRVKSAGAKLIVVDPRRTATAAKADLFLQIKPGTDLALLNGLLHLLHANGRTDADFIAAHTEGWEAMPGFLAGYPPAAVAEITGIPEDSLRQAAELIGEANEWMSCWTMGLNQSTHGTWNTNALVNLHLATGAICRPGSGPFSLTGQPNAMGGREMGYMGPGLPGQRSVLVDADRAFIEELWELEPGALRADGCRPGHGRDVPEDGCRGHQGVLDHLHQPGRLGREPQYGHRGPGGRGVRRHAGRVRRDGDQRVRRRRAARRDVDRGRGRPGQQRAHPHPRPAGRRPARRGDGGLADHRRRGLRDGLREGLRVRQRRGGLRGDQAGLEPGDRLGPARRELPAAAGRPGAVAGGHRGRARPQPDPVRRRGRLAGLPDRQRPGGLLRPPAPPGGGDARRRLPVRAQHRPAPAPVAHADENSQGGQAEQAQPRPVRRGAPAGRRRAGPRRRGSRWRSPRGAGGPCCPRSSPTGCGRAAVSRRSTGTTCSGSTSASTR